MYLDKGAQWKYIFLSNEAKKIYGKVKSYNSNGEQ